MSVRDRYADLGIDVSMLSEPQLEGVSLDILAEYGEIQPTIEQIEVIVARHQRHAELTAYEPSIDLCAVLDFEAENHPYWRKARLVRERFGCTMNRYQQLLLRAMDDPAAIRHAPALTARLRRIRDVRRALRTGWRGEVSA
jgi:hypothetical protein